MSLHSYVSPCVNFFGWGARISLRSHSSNLQFLHLFVSSSMSLVLTILCFVRPHVLFLPVQANYVFSCCFLLMVYLHFFLRLVNRVSWSRSSSPPSYFHVYLYVSSVCVLIVYVCSYVSLLCSFVILLTFLLCVLFRLFLFVPHPNRYVMSDSFFIILFRGRRFTKCFFRFVLIFLYYCVMSQHALQFACSLCFQICHD